MVYCTQVIATNQIEITSEDNIEEFLGTVMNSATFVVRGSKYGTMEVKFATIEEVALHATKILQNEQINLLPTYKGRRSSHIWIGGVIPEMKLVWVVVAILSTTKEKLETVSVSRTNHLNL